MGRLSRAETRQRNRATVLTAARAEFVERGFRDARIDAIAERAGLTRGAVYSNFPGKRALFFTVLADLTEQEAGTSQPGPRPGSPYSPGSQCSPGSTVPAALGALARAWNAKLPLTNGEHDDTTRLAVDLIPEVLADDLTRRPFTQLQRLYAIVLGLGLESLRAEAATKRLVPVAEAVLTTLHGANRLAAVAPGFVEPFNLVSACEQLANLDLGDGWPPPHLAHAPSPTPTDDPWSPPTAADALHGVPARTDGDGVVLILGLHRLSAVEEAIRADRADLTAALVTSAPGELMPLARFAVADLRSLVNRTFPSWARPRLQLIHDDAGALAEAAGVTSVSDATETAVRIEAGRIVSRADGLGACHAVAAAAPHRRRP